MNPYVNQLAGFGAYFVGFYPVVVAVAYHRYIEGGVTITPKIDGAITTRPK